MAAIIPRQIRAVDPYSESRFADNYNLRSRMVTGGRDVILFPDSFAITQAVNGTSFTVGPGVAIVDDVLIHITEDTVFDLSADTDAWLDPDMTGTPIPSGETSEFFLDLYLYYKNARTIPAPVAKLGLVRRGLTDPTIDTSDFLPIANITVQVNITNVYSYPALWDSNVNCGVIRINSETGLPYWYENWAGTSTTDEALTITP